MRTVFVALLAAAVVLPAQTVTVVPPTKAVTVTTVLDSVKVGDTLRGVRGVPVGTGGAVSTASKIRWSVSPGTGARVIDTTGVTGQTVSLVGLAAGTVQVTAAWRRSDGQTVTGTRAFKVFGGVVAPPPVVAAPTGAIWFDDFQSYTSQAQLVNGNSPIPAGVFFDSVKNGQISSVNSPGRIFLDLMGGPNGSKAMRYDWPAGVGGTVMVSPRIYPPLAGTTAITVGWVDKVSSNFTNGGNCVGSQCEYKYYLVKLGPSVQGTLSQIGVYLEGAEPNYWIVMDVTDRTNSINTTHAVRFMLPTGWRGNWHRWYITATGLGSANATFELFYDGQKAISLAGPFLPTLGSIGGGNDLIVLELGSNINTAPTVAQSRWWREGSLYYGKPAGVP